MALYKVVGCPKCARLQITIGEALFKCKYCGKSIRVASVRVFIASESNKDAREYLYRLQVELGER